MQEVQSITSDLRNLFARAALISRAAGDPDDLSFSAVLIAFLISNNPVSDWFKQYALEQQSGIRIDAFLAVRKLDRSNLVELARRPVSDELLEVEKLSTSPSIERIIKNARGLQSAFVMSTESEIVGDVGPLDVRHVMGAYIYKPAGHEDDLKTWNFNRPHWSNSFLELINRLHPTELPGWVQEHRRAFHQDPEILSAEIVPEDRIGGDVVKIEGEGVVVHVADSVIAGDINSGGKTTKIGQVEPPPTREQQQPPQPPPTPAPTPPVPEGEGPSPHIATDRWTVEDALGYRSYAYAIYRFITHENTSPPLTVSIQAPWGGGKTSLMRMVQSYLDPESPDQITKSSPEEAAQKSAPRLSASPAGDQEAPAPEEATSPLPTGEMTLDELLGEIDEWIQKRTKQRLPEIVLDSVPDQARYPRRLTVWFNAWKYESTNQVWAGLADAILQQVASRLEPAEREKFWFRLNLKRIDTDKLRVQVYQRIFNTFWQKSLPWIWGSGVALVAFLLAALGGWMSQIAALRNLGALGFIFSALGSGLILFSRYLETDQAAKKEPASVSLGEYLTVPDYRSQLSFIHQVDKDLRDVFACIPENYLPIVIFVDDLDRCSPEKVAEVVEGVNLFLAGDFPVCMFVLGMDPEMVAAALEAAHEKMIARLPKDASTPVGWRFMDKFVQLPFVIPPPTPKDLEGYTEALFSVSQKAKFDPDLRRLIHQLTQSTASDEALPTEAEHLIATNQVSPENAEIVRKQIKDVLAIKQQEKLLDVGIASFNDQDEEIRAQIRKAATSFSHNPRELKRFINAMRFNYYLLWTCVVRGYGQEITLDQLQRWVVLSMKWPEVVRWVRRSGGREGPAGSSGQAGNGRLCMLETLGKDSSNFQDWQKNAQARLELDPNSARWLHDEDLHQFFRAESSFPDGQRLSDAAGKGLW